MHDIHHGIPDGAANWHPPTQLAESGEKPPAGSSLDAKLNKIFPPNYADSAAAKATALEILNGTWFPRMESLADAARVREMFRATGHEAQDRLINAIAAAPGMPKSTDRMLDRVKDNLGTSMFAENTQVTVQVGDDFYTGTVTNFSAETGRVRVLITERDAPESVVHPTERALADLNPDALEMAA